MAIAVSRKQANAWRIEDPISYWRQDSDKTGLSCVTASAKHDPMPGVLSKGNG